MKCFTDYQWATPGKLLQVNTTALTPFLSILTEVKSDSVFPAVRIPMTASSWLGVTTKNSAANMGKYPDLGGQYRYFISQLVSEYTSRGIVVILDLHWIDDDAEQQPMATKSGKTSALMFWDSVATAFGKNSLVFFELYNEPHTNDVNAWMNGNQDTAGMLEMLAAVRKHSSQPCIIAGATGYAYDSASLLQIDKELLALQEENVIFNWHPLTRWVIGLLLEQSYLFNISQQARQGRSGTQFPPPHTPTPTRLPPVCPLPPVTQPHASRLTPPGTWAHATLHREAKGCHQTAPPVRKESL